MRIGGAHPSTARQRVPEREGSDVQQRRARNPLPTTTAPPPVWAPSTAEPLDRPHQKKKKKRKNKKDGPLCLDSTSPRGEPDPAVPGECGGLARLRHRGRPPYSRDGGGGGRRGTAGGGAVPTAVGSLSHPSDPHPPAPTTALPKWTRGPVAQTAATRADANADGVRRVVAGEGGGPKRSKQQSGLRRRTPSPALTGGWLDSGDWGSWREGAAAPC